VQAVVGPQQPTCAERQTYSLFLRSHLSREVRLKNVHPMYSRYDFVQVRISLGWYSRFENSAMRTPAGSTSPRLGGTTISITLFSVASLVLSWPFHSPELRNFLMRAALASAATLFWCRLQRQRTCTDSHGHAHRGSHGQYKCLLTGWPSQLFSTNRHAHRRHTRCERTASLGNAPRLRWTPCPAGR
jgi:hypothetical protein